jgi:hypothetical protein
VTLSSTPQTWTLEMPYGSLQEYLFTFTYPSTGALFPITGMTWEFVVRATGTSSGSPLISVTPSANSQGVLTVSTAASTVQLTLYPAATQSLATGQYALALWMNPGIADTAYTWLSGPLILQGNPQP